MPRRSLWLLSTPHSCLAQRTASLDSCWHLGHTCHLDGLSTVTIQSSKCPAGKEFVSHWKDIATAELRLQSGVLWGSFLSLNVLLYGPSQVTCLEFQTLPGLRQKEQRGTEAGGNALTFVCPSVQGSRKIVTVLCWCGTILYSVNYVLNKC